MQQEFKKIHTFSPQHGSKYASQMDTRTFDQFLHDQEKHSKRVTAKINCIKKEIEKETEGHYKYKPEINEVLIVFYYFNYLLLYHKDVQKIG